MYMYICIYVLQEIIVQDMSEHGANIAISSNI